MVDVLNCYCMAWLCCTYTITRWYTNAGINSKFDCMVVLITLHSPHTATRTHIHTDTQPQTHFTHTIVSKYVVPYSSYYCWSLSNACSNLSKWNGERPMNGSNTPVEKNERTFLILISVSTIASFFVYPFIYSSDIRLYTMFHRQAKLQWLLKKFPSISSWVAILIASIL